MEDALIIIIMCVTSLLLVLVSSPCASTQAQQRLSSWRSSAALKAYHTVTAMPGKSTRLSHYCGDSSIFPSLPSRTAANNAAKRGELLVNDLEVHGGTKVGSGDVLTLQTSPPPALFSPGELGRRQQFFHELTEEKPEHGGRLRVLYEDSDCAVVFKPPGVHSTPWAGTRKKWGDLTLCDALPLLLASPSEAEASDAAAASSLPAPLPAHRLDARVGGVLAVAKTRRALAELSRLFKERRVTKTYRAIVVGEVCPERIFAAPGQSVRATRGELGEFTCTLVLDDDNGPATWCATASNATSSAADAAARHARSTRTVVRVEQLDGGGRASLTEVRVVEVTPCAVHGALTTLELRPVSGRRHQLRIACAIGLGAPIVGDDLYHAEVDAMRAAHSLPPLPPVRRRAGLFLQAVKISLPHPLTAERLCARAPEMSRFGRLRRRAASGAAFTDEEWEEWRATA